MGASTLTLSRVMMPCGWIGIVTIRTAGASSNSTSDATITTTTTKVPLGRSTPWRPEPEQAIWKTRPKPSPCGHRRDTADTG